MFMAIINCPICGKRISPKLKNCPECGEELTKFDFSKQDTHDIESNAKRNKIIILVTIIIIAIIVLIVLLSLFILNTPATQDNSLERKPAKNEDNSSERKHVVDEPVEKDDLEQNISDSIVGVYNGNDHTILVIADNQLAYYYCSYPEYTELACPWSYDDGSVNIELAKMHCIITSKIDEDSSELIFKSESENWNTELFTRIDAEPDDYLSRKVLAYDEENVIINADGTMDILIGNLKFVVPKHYWNGDDELIGMNDAAAVVNVNVDTDYASGILFYESRISKNVNEEVLNVEAQKFTERFFLDVSTQLDKAKTINNYPVYIYDISGVLNKGFSGLAGYETDGKLALIYDKDSNSIIYVMFEQASNRKDDDTDSFYNVLSSVCTRD